MVSREQDTNSLVIHQNIKIKASYWYCYNPLKAIEIRISVERKSETPYWQSFDPFLLEFQLFCTNERSRYYTGRSHNDN